MREEERIDMSIEEKVKRVEDNLEDITHLILRKIEELSERVSMLENSSYSKGKEYSSITVHDDGRHRSLEDFGGSRSRKGSRTRRRRGRRY